MMMTKWNGKDWRVVHPWMEDGVRGRLEGMGGHGMGAVIGVSAG